MRVPFLSSACLIQWARVSLNPRPQTTKQKPRTTSFNSAMNIEVVVQLTRVSTEETDSPSDSFSHGLRKSAGKGQGEKTT